MIVGKRILDLGLISDADPSSLRNSTYNLEIHEIIPIGKEAIQDRHSNGKKLSVYYIEPREMVWVVSKETFSMPKTVTGIATLRTHLTRQGILALSAGIIDPGYRGPISTALINFSDKPRRIEIGYGFMRIAFFEHEDIADYEHVNDKMRHDTYIRNLENASVADFSSNFLNIPSFDDEYYSRKFWSIIWSGIWGNKAFSILLLASLLIIILFLFDQGLWKFFTEKWGGILLLKKQIFG